MYLFSIDLEHRIFIDRCEFLSLLVKKIELLTFTCLGACYKFVCEVKAVVEKIISLELRAAVRHTIRVKIGKILSEAFITFLLIDSNCSHFLLNDLISKGILAVR